MRRALLIVLGLAHVAVGVVHLVAFGRAIAVPAIFVMLVGLAMAAFQVVDIRRARRGAAVMLVLALSSSCSQATRRIGGRCPGAVPLFADFAIGGAALGASVDRYNEGQGVAAAALFGSAMVYGLAANMAECR